MIGELNLTARQKLELNLCYDALTDKKAEEILVLDLRGISSMADFFLICHGSSSQQVLAISDNVEKILRGNSMKRYHVEGRKNGTWVLMDVNDIVVHIFHEPTRRHYALENLWMDAPRMDNTKIDGWRINRG